MSRLQSYQGFDFTPEAMQAGERLKQRMMGQGGGLPRGPGGLEPMGPKSAPPAEFMPASPASPSAAPAAPWGDTITLPGTGEKMYARRQGGAVVETAPMSASPDLLRSWQQKQAVDDAQGSMGMLNTLGMDPVTAATLSQRRDSMAADLAAANMGRQQQQGMFDRQMGEAQADRQSKEKMGQADLDSRRELSGLENANKLKLAEINDPGRTAWAQAGAAVAMDPNASPELFARRKAMLGGASPSGGAGGPSAGPRGDLGMGGAAGATPGDTRADDILAAIRQTVGKATPAADGRGAPRYEIDSTKLTPESLAQLAGRVGPSMKGMTPQQQAAVAQQMAQGGMDMTPLRDKAAQSVMQRAILASGKGSMNAADLPPIDLGGGQSLAPIADRQGVGGWLGQQAATFLPPVGMYPTDITSMKLPDGTTVPFSREGMPRMVDRVYGTGISGQQERDASTNQAMTDLFRLLAQRRQQ